MSDDVEVMDGPALWREIARLRAALEEQLEAHNFDEVLEIARKALEGK